MAVRTTEPMLKSCCQFSMATWKSCRRGVEVGDDRLAAPVAVAVDDVAPVAVLEQLGVVVRVVRPVAGPRPDADLVVGGRRASRRTPANPRLRRVATVPDVFPDLSPDLGALRAGAVYAVVLGFVFVESGLLVGFFLPGDTILFGAGLVSAEPGSGVSLPLLAAGAFVAAVAGDSVGYTFGSRLGRGWLERRVAGGRLDERHLLPCRGVLPALGLVGGGGRALDPLGAHLHAGRRRDQPDAVRAVPVGQRRRRPGLGGRAARCWATRSRRSRR